MPDLSFQQPTWLPAATVGPAQSDVSDSAGPYCASSQIRSDDAAKSAAGYAEALTAADAGPLPTEFVATTVKAYVAPLVMPVTVHGDDGHDVVIVARAPSVGVAVTV